MVMTIEKTIDVYLDDDDINDILEELGLLHTADIVGLIDQAQLECQEITLPPRLRELLYAITGKDFGL